MQTLSEIKREPGVSDLPPKAKNYFAGAILYENKGQHEKAEHYLKKAIEKEADGE